MSPRKEQRIIVGVILLTLLGCAFLLAKGAMALVGSAVLRVEDAPSEKPTRSLPSGSIRKERVDGTPILQRNIFDSASGDMTIVPEPEGDDEVAIEEGDGPPPLCQGSTRLVASIYMDGRPEYSMASIASASGTAMLYREGMSVDGMNLVNIYPSMVILRPSGGRSCQLAMFDPEVGAAQPSRAPQSREEEKESPSPSSSGRLDADELDENIKKQSEGKYTVCRGLVNKVLENQAELMRAARIIPHEEDGRVVGIKLYGIRRNSLLGKLGLQNGDMLRNINGFDVTNPNKALEAFTKLQSASNISLAAVRRGSAMSVEYSINDC